MVNALIKQDSSPEQISNRLFMEQDILKHEWIHLYIDKNKRQGGDLYKLPALPEKAAQTYGKQDRRGCILNRVRIEQRLAILVSKFRIDDWEGNTIIGKGHRGVVTINIECKTKYTVLN